MYKTMNRCIGRVGSEVRSDRKWSDVTGRDNLWHPEITWCKVHKVHRHLSEIPVSGPVLNDFFSVNLRNLRMP